jgi:proliferating cell nuclear antigen PCNA
MKTIKSSAIRTLSEALKEILLETTIHFDPSGIRILTMDKSKTVFVHLKLEASKFDYYYCPNQRSIGINLTSLHKLFKTINNNDNITLFITKDDEERLGVRIDNKEKKIVSTSRIKLIDLDNEFYDIPSTKFQNIFTLQCVDFQKHCRDISGIADEVDIYANKNVFTMVAMGDNTDQEIKICDSESDDDVEPVFIGRYMCKFLLLFCKSSGMCPTVEIFFKENFPMIVIYSVADLGTIKFGLCPIKKQNFD